MGNFSRDTFDPSKGYVGVRLQQGVPLVDADWNELNDVIRNEIYQGLDIAFPGGFIQASFRVIELQGATNDFLINLGFALIKGRPLVARGDGIRYSEQPWIDPDRAREDNVDVIPPLTTPRTIRIDLVYLDIWEREVDSNEDSELINRSIAVETCVRLKREIAIRVAEGTEIPTAPDGHTFVNLARLIRQPRQANITTDEIQDVRPILNIAKGESQISFVPAFVPISLSSNSVGTSPNWIFVNEVVRFGVIGETFIPQNIYALKPPDNNAQGILPLTLPQGAELLRLRVKGFTKSLVPRTGTTLNSIVFQLLRIDTESEAEPGRPSPLKYDIVFKVVINHTRGDISSAPFDQSSALPLSPLVPLSSLAHNDSPKLIDNRRYYYVLLATSRIDALQASINHIFIDFKY